MSRGKTDKADAKMISRYSWMRKDELKENIPIKDTQIELQQLMNYRDKLVADKASYKIRKEEMGKQLVKKLSNPVKNSTDKIVELLKAEI